MAKGFKYPLALLNLGMAVSICDGRHELHHSLLPLVPFLVHAS